MPIEGDIRDVIDLTIPIRIGKDTHAIIGGHRGRIGIHIGGKHEGFRADCHPQMAGEIVTDPTTSRNLRAD